MSTLEIWTVSTWGGVEHVNARDMDSEYQVLSDTCYICLPS